MKQIRVTLKVSNLKQAQSILTKEHFKPGSFSKSTISNAKAYMATPKAKQELARQTESRNNAKAKIKSGATKTKEAFQHGMKESIEVATDVIDSFADQSFKKTIEYVKRGGGAKDSISLFQGMGDIVSGIWDFFKA